MKNSWSSQILIPVAKKVNGDQETTEQTLVVCVEGQKLFDEQFANGKYKGENTLAVPFDFIVLGGSPCPRGKFYEVEYTVGSERGMMHSALIQVVDPVTDLRIVLGLLRHKGIIQDEIFTHKAYLRSDIEAVNICHCEDNEDGYGPCCYGSFSHTRPEDTVSIFDKWMGKDPTFPEFSSRAMCFEYWAKDDCVEFWLREDMEFDTKPVFVCGSDNVWDVAFADMSREDMVELQDHLDSAIQILSDYGMQHLIYTETGAITVNAEGKKQSPAIFARRCSVPFLRSLIDILIKECSTGEHTESEEQNDNATDNE